MESALELAATVLRGVHIAAGAVALFSFGVPLAVPKGNATHRRAGKVYVRAMFVAAATAVALAPIRMIERPVERWSGPVFLAYVALLSFASASYGVAILRQKNRSGPHEGRLAYVAPSLLAVAAVGMVVFGLRTGFTLGLFFAPIGWLVAIPQIRTLRAAPTERRFWLVEHLSSMLVSCVATTTAFLVVNAGRFFPAYTLVAWIAPTILGVPLIVRWRRVYQRAAPPA